LADKYGDKTTVRLQPQLVEEMKVACARRKMNQTEAIEAGLRLWLNDTPTKRLQGDDRKYLSDAGTNAGITGETTLNPSTSVDSGLELLDNPHTAIMDTLQELSRSMARLESRVHMVESGIINALKNIPTRAGRVSELPPLLHRSAGSSTDPKKRRDSAPASTGDHPGEKDRSS
jgi:hypothetical protein